MKLKHLALALSLALAVQPPLAQAMDDDREPLTCGQKLVLLLGLASVVPGLALPPEPAKSFKEYEAMYDGPTPCPDRQLTTQWHQVRGSLGSAPLQSFATTRSDAAWAHRLQSFQALDAPEGRSPLVHQTTLVQNPEGGTTPQVNLFVPHAAQGDAQAVQIRLNPVTGEVIAQHATSVPMSTYQAGLARAEGVPQGRRGFVLETTNQQTGQTCGDTWTAPRDTTPPASPPSE